jgi:hypothetical protein
MQYEVVIGTLLRPRSRACFARRAGAQGRYQPRHGGGTNSRVASMSGGSFLFWYTPNGTSIRAEIAVWSPSPSRPARPFSDLNVRFPAHSVRVHGPLVKPAGAFRKKPGRKLHAQEAVDTRRHRGMHGCGARARPDARQRTGRSPVYRSGDYGHGAIPAPHVASLASSSPSPPLSPPLASPSSSPLPASLAAPSSSLPVPLAPSPPPRPSLVSISGKCLPPQRCRACPPRPIVLRSRA